MLLVQENQFSLMNHRIFQQRKANALNTISSLHLFWALLTNCRFFPSLDLLRRAIETFEIMQTRNGSSGESVYSMVGSRMTAVKVSSGISIYMLGGWRWPLIMLGSDRRARLAIVAISRSQSRSVEPGSRRFGSSMFDAGFDKIPDRVLWPLTTDWLIHRTVHL